jgi:hypothetical protein
MSMKKPSALLIERRKKREKRRMKNRIKTSKANQPTPADFFAWRRTIMEQITAAWVKQAA